MQTGNDWQNLFLLLSAMMSFDDRTKNTDKAVFETAVSALRDVYSPHISISPQAALSWFEIHRKDIIEFVNVKEDAERVLTDILERLAPIPVNKELLLVLMEIAMSKERPSVKLDPIMNLNKRATTSMFKSA